tara:strand:+ start:3862 stop:4017 length:156 start_codon:yes stop_codon:yes gene_type:complete
MNNEEEAAMDEKRYYRKDYIKKYKKIILVRKLVINRTIYPDLTIIDMSFNR